MLVVLLSTQIVPTVLVVFRSFTKQHALKRKRSITWLKLAWVPLRNCFRLIKGARWHLLLVFEEFEFVIQSLNRYKRRVCWSQRPWSMVAGKYKLTSLGNLVCLVAFHHWFWVSWFCFICLLCPWRRSPGEGFYNLEKCTCMSSFARIYCQCFIIIELKENM